MSALHDKVAIITGASSGIGRATATLFAREGAKVVITARRDRELSRLETEIRESGGQAVRIAGDVSDEDLARELVDVATNEFGGLDVAINNAGTYGAAKPVTELSLDEWAETVNTNLTGSFIGAKHQAAAMLEAGRGSIVFVSSFVGHTIGFPDNSDYAASKAGQLGLMKALASELGPRGIRVNAILPGGTDTPMNIASAPDAGPELGEFVQQLHALKRIASPGEIARAALFLGSDASSFVTGASLLVDGGVSVTRT